MKLPPVVAFDIGPGADDMSGVDLAKFFQRRADAELVQDIAREVEATGRYEFVQLIVGALSVVVVRDHGAEAEQ